MTGPAVDVEQPVKAATDLVVEWGSGDLSPGRMRNMIAELLVERDAAYNDLIRRQDAALTAVRELADRWADQGADAYRTGSEVVVSQVDLRAALALASPDTTQEGL